MEDQTNSKTKSMDRKESDRKSIGSKPKSEKSPTESSFVDWDNRFGVWKLIIGQTDPNLPLYARTLTNEGTIFLLRQFKLCTRDVEGNRYLVKDVFGENLFYGIENNYCSDRICICGSSRAFTLTFFDANRAPALQLYRPCRLNCCGIIPFCRQKIQVKDSEDKTIGEVTEKFNLCRLSLKLVSKDNNSQLRVYGPSCDLKMRSYSFDDLCFEIKDKSQTTTPTDTRPHICKISELTSGGHIYQIYFGQFGPEIKSLLIAAVILIDYYYFENSYHEHKYHNMSRASQALPPFPLVPKVIKH